MISGGLDALVTFNPTSVGLDTTIDQLLDMVHTLNIHHWPVVDDERRVLGLVSETDLVRAMHNSLLAKQDVPHDGDWRPTTVADIMSPKAVMIELGAPPRTALELLLASGVSSLPVLNDGRLIAILTTTDFLRELTYAELPAARETVSKYMSPIEDTLDGTETLEAGLLHLLKSGNEHLVITRGGMPIGVLTRQELSRARCRQAAAEACGQAEASSTLLSVVGGAAPHLRPVQKLKDAANLMLDTSRKAAAVVNQALQLQGIVSEADLLRAMVGQI